MQILLVLFSDLLWIYKREVCTISYPLYYLGKLSTSQCDSQVLLLTLPAAERLSLEVAQQYILAQQFLDKTVHAFKMQSNLQVTDLEAGRVLAVGFELCV